MTHTNARRLPSLAHPVLVEPWQRAKTDEAGLWLLPTPEINRNWPGFTFSHLPWVGIKAGREILSHSERPGVGVALLHEHGHIDLAHLPFSLVKKYEMFICYDMMLKAVEGKGERLEVPLDPEKSRNQLEKQWERFLRLQKGSMLVEEVYAVRSSLLKASDEGFIERDDPQNYAKVYKQQYGEDNPLFPNVYNAFDVVAEKLGEDAALAMIFSVLETLNPDLAFIDLLSELCQVDLHVSSNGIPRTLSAVYTGHLRNPSLQQTFRVFSQLIDRLDHDSRYNRRDVLDRVEKIKKEWHAVSQRAQDNLAKFLLGTPKTIIFSYYNRSEHKFCKFKVTEEVRGHFIILLEAIRQQLTTGRGLLCPFWGYVSDRCCSSRNRAFLEKVWSCTSHCHSCTWQRIGCLDKKAVPLRNSTCEDHHPLGTKA